MQPIFFFTSCCSCFYGSRLPLLPWVSNFPPFIQTGYSSKESCKFPLFLAYAIHNFTHSSGLFQSITNKMQLFIIHLFLQNVLHVSGGSSSHHQELNTVHKASVSFKLILLSATIVEELELIWHLHKVQIDATETLNKSKVQTTINQTDYHT
jgi:hypothetical protein